MSPEQTPNLPVPAEERCLNCNAVLFGEYCAHCGQHVKHHVHSTAHVVAELFEDLTHADNRVWHTLKSLLRRPGEVTVEYLRGKRASYTPPFRLYIVLSLLFFLTASLSHDEETKVLVLNNGNQTYALTEATQEKLNDFLERLDPEDRDKARGQLEDILKRTPPEEQEEIASGVLDACSSDKLGRVLPESLLGRKQLLRTCERLAYGKGDELTEKMREHVPQMLFFLLPVIALLGKLLYVRSKRYYAEHLLFFVYFHAFFFLAGAIYNVADWLLDWFKSDWADIVSGLLLTALIFYIPIYLYRAMRRVYPQQRWKTRLKFFFLLGGYMWSLLLTFVGMAAIATMMLG